MGAARRSRPVLGLRPPEEGRCPALRCPSSVCCWCSADINGSKYLALNGGPEFAFTEAISIQVACDTQKEIDYHWRKLTAGGGSEVQCGWLKDKFGLSWQVFPAVLPRLLKNKDRAKADRVMKAMMKMVKIDMRAIEKAAKGAAV